MFYVTFASDEHDAEKGDANFRGPRQEFFCLLVNVIFQESGAFEGDKVGF